MTRIPLTWALLLAIWCVFLATQPFGVASEHSAQQALDFGASERSHIWAGEWWRLITPVFLHLQWWHIGLNSVMVLLLGALIEIEYGRWRMLAITLICGTAGSALSVLAHDAVSSGISGVLFGWLALLHVKLYRDGGNLRTYLARPGVKSDWLMLGLLFILGATGTPIDNFGHAGGLVSGLLLGLIGDGRRLRWFGWVKLGLVLALWAVLVVGATVRWPGQTSRLAAMAAFQDGYQLSRNKSYAAARHAYSKAIELGYDDSGAYFNRALAARELEDWAGVITDLTAAIAMNPTDADAYRLRAEAYFRMGRVPEASADLQRAARAGSKP